MLDDIFLTAQARPFNPFEEDMPGALVVFGTGARGRRCRRRLERMGIRVPCFADNNPDRQGTVLDGLPVVAPDGLADAASGVPVIICSFARREIFSQLVRMGLREIYCDCLAENLPLPLLGRNAAAIAKVRDRLADDHSKRVYEDVIRHRFFGTPLPLRGEYPIYAHPLVRAEPGDCVVDGGAASGDTAALFLGQTGANCTIHSFEPTPGSYGELARYAAGLDLPAVHPHEAALWSEEGFVTFFEAFEMSHGNRIGGHGELRVEAVTLDGLVRKGMVDRVDLIKLDVEGAELAALQGARETIRRFKPRLQVCLYHKPADLWELPLFLADLAPEYRMFLGHHSDSHLDTVLYCRT